MTNAYYNPTGTPAQNSQALSSPMRAEFSAIGRGFDALPTITTTGSFNTVFAQQAVVTLTLPPYDGTLATLAGAETLTNKTLAAPTITGVANAPTAAPGTNTTQVATTAFTTAAVAVETTRATAAEAANASAITTETARATAAEAALSSPASLTVTGALTAGSVTTAGAVSAGSLAVSGNSQVNGNIYCGTSGQFYLDPNNSGFQLLNFAANQYIQFVPGTGFQFATSGSIQLSAPAGCTLNGNAVITQNSSPTFLNLTANGVVTVGGQETLSGNSYFFTNSTGGLQQTAWTFGIGINCSSGSNGVVAAGFFTNSDARLKTDIEEIGADEAVGWIKRGRPVRFKWLDGGKPTAGFIAQDELANQRNGGSVLQVPDTRQRFAAGGDGAEPGKRLEKDYSHEIPYLTKALQAALSNIETMVARIEALEASISGLEASISGLEAKLA